MAEAERGGRFRAVLAHRNYRLLLAGLAVSETGNWLYAAASVIYILNVTGSAAWVGAAAVIRLLPYLLFEPLGGAIADRYDRRKLMIALDLVRAAVTAAMAVVAISESHSAVAVVIGLTFLNNVFTAPYYPAVTAMTPSLVPERELASANALSGTIDNFALAFGPALSALLLLLGPPPIAIGVNTLTFLFSAYLVWRMDVHGKVGEVEAESSLFAQIRAGGRAIRNSKEAILLVGLAGAFGLTFGQEVVLFGPIAEESLKLGYDATGWLFAVPGVGGLLVVAWAARLASRAHTAAILTVATFVAGIPLMTLAFVQEPAVAFLVLTIEGAAVIIADIVTTTTLQRVVPNDRVGSAFGILGAVTVIGTVIGSLVAPFTIELLGLRAATGIGGGVLLVLTLIVLPRARGIDRKAAARALELAPRVALLERLGIFEGTSPQQLEALAAIVAEERVAPGTVVIREGDEPDDLFAIASGEVRVTQGEGADEREIRTMSEGEYFGEIGLLEKRPRTATVIAMTECDLYRIPGEDFLRIVNEGPRLSPTLLSVVASRLATSDPYEELGHS